MFSNFDDSFNDSVFKNRNVILQSRNFDLSSRKAHIPATSSLSEVSRSVRVAERLALPTSDHGVADSNPAGGEILPEPKRRFIAQSLSYSPFHRLEMTEIVLKGRKTLTHPSILSEVITMLKGTKKHEDKEQCKTIKHEAIRSINHKATQNENNIGTTA